MLKGLNVSSVENWWLRCFVKWELLHEKYITPEAASLDICPCKAWPCDQCLQRDKEWRELLGQLGCRYVYLLHHGLYRICVASLNAVVQHQMPLLDSCLGPVCNLSGSQYNFSQSLTFFFKKDVQKQPTELLVWNDGVHQTNWWVFLRAASNPLPVLEMWCS